MSPRKLCACDGPRALTAHVSGAIVCDLCGEALDRGEVRLERRVARIEKGVARLLKAEAARQKTPEPPKPVKAPPPRPMMNGSRPPLRTSEVAALLGLSTEAVRRNPESLGGYKLPGHESKGHWLYPAETIRGLAEGRGS